MRRFFCRDAKLLNKLLVLGQLLLKFLIAALRVIKLVLEHGLFTFQLLLMLFHHDELLILQIFQLVLQRPKLALLVFDLPRCRLHLVLKLRFTVGSLHQLIE